MLSKSEARISYLEQEASAALGGRSEDGSSSGNHRQALQPDSSGAADVAARGGDHELLCSAASLMIEEHGVDFDLRQKSVELATAIVVKLQNEQKRYSAPFCITNARSQLLTWLKSQVNENSTTLKLL
jgi:hypothetical protein